MEVVVAERVDEGVAVAAAVAATVAATPASCSAAVTLGMVGRRLRYADLVAETGVSPLPVGEPF